MEIVNHIRKILDAMEINAKGNNNFSIKIIRTKIAEGKSYIFTKKYGKSKKKDSNLFFSIFHVIPFSD